MHILLANDDGIFAPGLTAMYRALEGLGDVTVVAPADVMSGAGHSITLRDPLVCNHVDVNGIFTGYSVSGSPADCVKLGVTELCPRPVDLVVSGINSGSNAGIDVYYSGTVAAAMEGAFCRIPSVAMSMVLEEPMDWEAGAMYCRRVLEKILDAGRFEVVNVNLPALSKGKPKGVKVVKQSQLGCRDRYDRKTDTEGRLVYMLQGPQGHRETETSDVTELAEGYITVTPLHSSMTDNRRMHKLQNLEFEISTVRS